MKPVIQAIIRFLPVVVMMLMGVVIAVANQYVTLGKDVKYTDTTIMALQDENELLKQQVASASSLLTIEKLAVERGFVPAKKYLTVDGSFDVAVNLPK